MSRFQWTKIPKQAPHKTLDYWWRPYKLSCGLSTWKWLQLQLAEIRNADKR